jgi:F-type H+-transporting ATPase subunit delta
MSYKLSHRYAKSIIDLSIEQGKLDVVHADILLLDETILTNAELVSMLRSPVIPSDKKLKVMSLIFENKVDIITWKFIELVIKKGRESNLVDFGRSFIDQYNIIKKISKVNITTAVELGENVMESIKQNLAKSLPNVNLQIDAKTDHKLIGGFKLQYGDNLYDATIQKKLKDLRSQFLDESYVEKV